MRRKIRIRCIKDGLTNVTKGKVYELIFETGGFYEIVNDNSSDISCPKEFFEVIEEDKDIVYLG